jgi:hypothetical protein
MFAWIFDRFACSSDRATTRRAAYYVRRVKLVEARTKLKLAKKAHKRAGKRPQLALVA